MGLDGVELVMRVEKEFGIEIPDGEAGELTTVGELYEYLVKRLNASRVSTQRCLTSHAFYRVRVAVEKAFPHGSGSVRPDTRLAELLPDWRKRRPQWKHLEKGLALKITCPLRRPIWVWYAIATQSIVCGFLVVAFGKGFGVAILVSLVSLVLLVLRHNPALR